METEKLLRLYCKLFDFQEAQNIYEKCLIGLDLENPTDFEKWVTLLPTGLRIYSELENHEKIAEIKKAVTDVPEEKSNSLLLSLKGRFSFQQKDFSLSNQLFSKALELASHERERSQALFGLGLSHYYLGSQETSFSYFLSLYEGSRELEFRASALNFMAMIHNSKNQFSEAFGMIEKTKTLAKDDRNLYLHVYALIIEAEFYLLKGDFFSAQKAVLMAEVFVPNNYVCAAKNKLSSLKEKIATSLQEPGFEVVESESQTTVKTPDHSAVDFSSQPILLNLLKTLAGSPRRVVSKEEIAKSLWSQDYHPLHMDNKIYVTVRRLRKLLGDNTEKPVFILKKEDGYVLNPEFRFTLFQRKYFENQTEAR